MNSKQHTLNSSLFAASVPFIEEVRDAKEIRELTFFGGSSKSFEGDGRGCGVLQECESLHVHLHQLTTNWVVDLATRTGVARTVVRFWRAFAGADGVALVQVVRTVCTLERTFKDASMLYKRRATDKRIGATAKATLRKILEKIQRKVVGGQSKLKDKQKGWSAFRRLFFSLPLMQW